MPILNGDSDPFKSFKIVIPKLPCWVIRPRHQSCKKTIIQKRVFNSQPSELITETRMLLTAFTKSNTSLNPNLLRISISKFKRIQTNDGLTLYIYIYMIVVPKAFRIPASPIPKKVQLRQSQVAYVSLQKLQGYLPAAFGLGLP